MEAAVFGNIAFCYGKDQQDKMQIDFCSKVLDRSLYIDDVNMLIKAYLRRGLAYESTEKFKNAIIDLMRVRELQPMNKQAQQGIQRCQKYIKEDEGALFIPNEDDLALPDLPELKPKGAEATPAPAQAAAAAAAPVQPAKPVPVSVDEVKKPEPTPVKQPEPAPVKQPEPAPEQPKEEEKQPEPTPEDEAAPYSATPTLSNTDVAQLEEKLAAFKEKGNNQFRKKQYKEAVKHFSEAVKAFEDAGRPVDRGDVKTKITQIYTNRATSLHLLG
mmetsp:Transcript_8207/g.11362  ORF Transcript_8207/g.11362 Transcript_8207/m.11362 type:complete len:272 (-) Transcript_8207:955-1770(-)